MNNTAAEMAIIGAMILFPEEAAPSLIESMAPDKFNDAFLKKAYIEAMNMFAHCGYVDIIPMSNKLVDNEHDEAECKLLLMKCGYEITRMSALPSYIKVVNDCFKARELSNICNQYLLDGITADGINERLEKVGQKIGDLLRDDRKKGLKRMEDIVGEQYTRLFDKAGAKDRLKTGFKRYDSIVKGINRKNLVILAARPAVGKSAMALNLALNFSMSGKRVAMYSLEMGEEELYERLVANLAPANLGIIRDRDFGADTSRKIADASGKLLKLPIYINDSGYQTVQTIRSEVQIKGIDVVVIDYLQLLSCQARTNNRNDEVAKITRELKMMAQDLDIPVIVLSQLSRNKSDTQEPSLTDLRDSGAIEQDANMVWFMWRNGDQEDEQTKQIAFRVAKNRSGMTGSVVLNYYGSNMRFEETHNPIIKNTKRKTIAPWDEAREVEDQE